MTPPTRNRELTSPTHTDIGYREGSYAEWQQTGNVTRRASPLFNTVKKAMRSCHHNGRSSCEMRGSSVDGL